MRVSYPWKFKSENYHIRLVLKENIDLSKHFNASSNKYFDVSTNDILLTFSNVISSINEKEKIEYHEFIVKCKVKFKGNTYYYPLMTFVDNAYSIIRGYYLGFEKEISNISVENDNISVENKLINLKINTKLVENKEEYDSYPFILVRNYSFDEDTKVEEVVQLVSKDYLRNKEESFEISEGDTVELLRNIGVSADLVIKQKNYYVEDEFVLEGVRRI